MHVGGHLHRDRLSQPGDRRIQRGNDRPLATTLIVIRPEKSVVSAGGVTAPVR